LTGSKVSRELKAVLHIVHPYRKFQVLIVSGALGGGTGHSELRQHLWIVFV